MHSLGPTHLLSVTREVAIGPCLRPRLDLEATATRSRESGVGGKDGEILTKIRHLIDALGRNSEEPARDGQTVDIGPSALYPPRHMTFQWFYG